MSIRAPEPSVSLVRSTFTPFASPVTSPVKRPSVRTANADFTSRPSTSMLAMDEKLPELSTNSTRASPPETRSARLDSTLICVVMPSGLPFASIEDRGVTIPADSTAPSATADAEWPEDAGSSVGSEPPPHATRTTAAEGMAARRHRAAQVRKPIVSSPRITPCDGVVVNRPFGRKTS
jgi:hypothetical protein